MMQSYYNGTAKETLEGRDGWYRSEQAKRAAGSPADWKATGGYLVDGVKITGTDDQGNPIYAENDIYVNPRPTGRLSKTSRPSRSSSTRRMSSSASWRFRSDSRNAVRKTPIAGVQLTAFARNLCILYTT